MTCLTVNTHGKLFSVAVLEDRAASSRLNIPVSRIILTLSYKSLRYPISRCGGPRSTDSATALNTNLIDRVTHDDFIVLHHWKIRARAQCADMPLSGIILVLS